MKFYLSLLLSVMLLISCKDASQSSSTNEPELHKAIVQEVFHVNEFSYIRVLEDGVEKWIAAPTTVVEIGGVYYFGKTMEMKNFESKDLNKSFETIYFVEKISASKEDTALPLTTNSNPVSNESPKPVIEKIEVKVKATGSSISIAELFKNKEKYNNTIVQIKGEVTKFNPAIMSTNWVHIQDGTEFNGEFDLTVTTSEIVQLGDVVTISGKVTLNKDFGAGYIYAVIIENAAFIN